MVRSILVVIAVTLTAVTAEAKGRTRAQRVKAAEAQFVEGMRRYWRSGCFAALPAFEGALAERPGGRHEELAQRWVEKCREVVRSYEELDSPPGTVVAGVRDPYADLDSPPRLGYDEPELE